MGRRPSVGRRGEGREGRLVSAGVAPIATVPETSTKSETPGIGIESTTPYSKGRRESY